MKNANKPFLTLGEIVKFIIEAFNLNEGIFKEEFNTYDDLEKARKNFRLKLNRFAKEDSFNIEKADEFIDETFGKYLVKIFGDSNYAKAILSLGKTIFYSYRDLVLNVKSQLLSREYVFRYILFEYFLDYIAHLVFIFKEKFPLIDTPQEEDWFLITIKGDQVIYPIQKVLEWWIDVIGENNFKNLAVLMGGSDEEINYEGSQEWRTYYVRNARWKNVDNLPKANTIIDLMKYDFGDVKDQERMKKSLIINLLIARAVQYTTFEFYKVSKIEDENIKKSYLKLKEEFERLVNLKLQKIDPCDEYNMYYLYHALAKNHFNELIAKLVPVVSDEWLEDYNNQITLLNTLKELTSLDQIKKNKDYEEAVRIINQLSDSNSIIHPYYTYKLLWRQARMNALQGEFEKAIDYYQEAFESAKYRGGEDLKEIIREGYCIASYTERNEILNKMHKWGVAYKLFPDKYKETSKWIITLQKQQFFKIFNYRYFYPFVSNEVLRRLKSEKVQIYKYNLENLGRDLSDWKKERVLESRNEINELHGYPFKTYNQLMKFAITGQLDKVKIAIERGADINIQNNDNATALIYSLQEGYLKVASYLLDQEKISKKINKLTFKEKLNVFSELTMLSFKKVIKDEELYLTVLDQLIEKKAKVNYKYFLNQITPLYGYVRLLGDPHNLSSCNDDVFLQVQHALRDESLRVTSNKTFGKELYKEYEDIKKEIKPFFNVPLEKLKRNRNVIIKAIYRLLEHPDIKVDEKNYRGYTPLLMAAQLGEVEIFKMLMEKEANLYEITDGKQTVLDLSLIENQFEMANYILEQCNVHRIVSLSQGWADHVDRLYFGLLDKEYDECERILVKSIISKLNPYSGKLIMYNHMLLDSPKLFHSLDKKGFFKGEEKTYDQLKLYNIMEKLYSEYDEGMNKVAFKMWEEAKKKF